MTEKKASYIIPPADDHVVPNVTAGASKWLMETRLPDETFQHLWENAYDEQTYPRILKSDKHYPATNKTHHCW
jgi:hypothetical protein